MDRRNQTIENASLRSGSTTALHASRAAGLGHRPATDGGAHQATRLEFATWLVAGRAARDLSREHVARVTRIQLRTIERLEEGRFDELPADVFVRGFIRNYARCVGLSVDEALVRYGACGFAAAPVTSPSVQAIALLDTMAPLSGRTSSVTVVPPRAAPMMLKDDRAPVAAAAPAPVVAPAVAPVPVVVEAATIDQGVTRRVTAGGRRVRDSKGRFVRGGTVSGAMDVVAPPHGVPAELLASFEPAAVPAVPANGVLAAGAFGAFGSSSDALMLLAEAATTDESLDVEMTLELGSGPVTLAPSDGLAASTAAAVAAPVAVASTVVRPPALSSTPTLMLVIDDDDPEAAERAREQRAKDAEGGGWRSFLPPALLDQDRNRQGGLTLAVIILLIVATLTLSYLMRRPSSTGEGVTVVPTVPSQSIS